MLDVFEFCFRSQSVYNFRDYRYGNIAKTTNVNQLRIYIIVCIIVIVQLYIHSFVWRCASEISYARKKPVHTPNSSIVGYHSFYVLFLLAFNNILPYHPTYGIIDPYQILVSVICINIIGIVLYIGIFYCFYIFI